MSEPESGAPAKPQAKRSVSEQMGIPVTSVNPESMHMPPEAVERKPVTSNVTKFLFEYGKKQRFPEGTYFIREGHSDKTVFVILSGEVEVLKKDENGNDKVITKLSGGGTILGEMSIFTDQPRSSSVRASQDTLALEFTGDNFLSAVVKIPELSMRLLKTMSNKINSTNEAVTALSYSQAVLVCAAYLLDQRPHQNEKESSVTISLQQISTETGLNKRVVRSTFERLNRRGVVMGLSFNQISVSGNVNYPKLMRLLKSVTYPRPKEQGAAETGKKEEAKDTPPAAQNKPDDE